MDLGPKGHLDSCVLRENNQLRLQGWAANIPPENKIQEVQVWINGQLKQTCMPKQDRRDVSKFFADRKYLRSGWATECKLEKESQIDADILMIKAISGNNKERVLHLSTLEKALSGPLAINKQNLMTQVLEIMAGAVSSVKQLLSVAHDPDGQIKGCLDRVA